MSEQINETVLNVDQRRKRAMVMRRYKEKLKRARELAKSKQAPEKNIKKRAAKLARETVRERVAGERGKKYSELSTSEKIAVDKLIDTPDKVKLIRKLAQRLIPKVRRMEQERLMSFMKGHQLKNLGKPEGHHTVNEDLTEAHVYIHNNFTRETIKVPAKVHDKTSYSAKVEYEHKGKKYNHWLSSTDKEYPTGKLSDSTYVRKSQMPDRTDSSDREGLNLWAHVPKDKKMNEELNKLFNEYFASAGLPGRGAMGGPAQTSNKMIGKDKDKKKDNGKSIIQYQPFQDEKKNPKVNEALERKAEKSGIDFDILSEVYTRGLAAYPENCKVTREQYAFARVNSFINQGKTYFNEDADLQEISKATLKSYLEKTKEGTGKNYPTPLAFRKSMESQGIAKAKLGRKPRRGSLPDVKVMAGGKKSVKEDCASTKNVDKLKNAINKLKAAHKNEKAHDKALGESYSHLSIADLRKHAEHAIKTNNKNKVQEITAELKSRLEKKTGQEYKAPTKYGAKAVADFERISGKKVPDHLKETLALYEELKESRFYNTFHSGKAASIQNRLNKRSTETPAKSKWKVELKLKDGSTAKHEVEGTDFHNAVMNAKETDPSREFHPLGGHKAWKLNEGKMKELSVDVKELDNGNFKKKYGKSKEQMTFDLQKPKEKTVTEAKKMKGKDPCWKGYTMVGTKKKNGKDVPNCVPANESAPEIGAPIPHEKSGTKARKELQTVPRSDDNRKTTGRSTRHQEVLKKIIHEKLGNKSEDPKKREVGTDDIVVTYKADTPFAEEAKSSDRKPVVIPSFTRRNDDGSTVTIPSKTVLRKSNRKIVGDGNPHDGKTQ